MRRQSAGAICQGETYTIPQQIQQKRNAPPRCSRNYNILQELVNLISPKSATQGTLKRHHKKKNEKKTSEILN